MKLIGILAMVILPMNLMAQSNTIEATPESSLDWWTRAIVMESLSISNAPLPGSEAINTGIGLQLIRADQPLQLLNPIAPKSYGTGEQNVIWDLFTKQPIGLKLFSINF